MLDNDESTSGPEDAERGPENDPGAEQPSRHARAAKPSRDR